MAILTQRWCTKIDKYQVCRRFDKFHVCLDITSERNAGIHREAVCCWIPDSNWICVNAICRCILSPHCTENLLLLLFLSLITNHYSYLYHHGSHLKTTHNIAQLFVFFPFVVVSVSLTLYLSLSLAFSSALKLVQCEYIKRFWKVPLRNQNLIWRAAPMAY